MNNVMLNASRRALTSGMRVPPNRHRSASARKASQDQGAGMRLGKSQGQLGHRLARGLTVRACRLFDRPAQVDRHAITRGARQVDPRAGCRVASIRRRAAYPAVHLFVLHDPQPNKKRSESEPKPSQKKGKRTRPRSARTPLHRYPVGARRGDGECEERRRAFTKIKSGSTQRCNGPAAAEEPCLAQRRRTAMPCLANA